MSAEQRRSLVAAKLKGLIRNHLGSELTIDESLGVAGGFVASGADSSADGPRHGVFHAADDRMAGPALIWALRAGVDHLHLVCEPAAAGALARRADGGDRLTVDVLAIAGTDLESAAATPVPTPPQPTSAMWDLANVISDAGARPVDDHGRIVAEVAGLEVARIDEPADGVPEIEVGVGEADRELHALVHTTLDADTALRRAIAMVAAERRPGSMHPLARMARERWLRSFLLDDPSLVGLDTLAAVPPLVARATVLGNVPSAAVGADAAGATVVVVCSSGIDLDLVPEAADYRRREAPDARLVLVVPERDRHAVTEALVAITPDCELIGVAAPWLD